MLDATTMLPIDLISPHSALPRSDDTWNTRTIYPHDHKTPTLLIIFRPTGLKIKGYWCPAPGPDGGFWSIRSIQGSLPRLLHGENSRLLKNEEEVQAAFTKLRQLLAGIGMVWRSSDFRFAAVELAWQLNYDFDNLVLAHRNLRLGKVQSEPTNHGKNGLTWGRAEKVAKVYDKVAERRHHRLPVGSTRPVPRVEVRLKGGKLVELLGGLDGMVRYPGFDRLYQVYRNVLLEFPTQEVPLPGSIEEFLALGEVAGWNHNGVPALELYLRSLKPAYATKLRRKVGRAVCETLKFNWADILPEAGPPPPLELVKGQLREHRADGIVNHPFEVDDSEIFHRWQAAK